MTGIVVLESALSVDVGLGKNQCRCSSNEQLWQVVGARAGDEPRPAHPTPNAFERVPTRRAGVWQPSLLTESTRMEEYELRFSPISQSDTGAFKLLELPPDLCKLVENSIESLGTPPFVMML